MATQQLVARPRDKQLRILGITADYETAAIPPGHIISYIAVYNRTANAITGGLDIGSTVSGEEIVSQHALGASAFVQVLDSAILKRGWSMTVRQVISISAHTAWNSANIDVFIGLSKLRP